MEEEEGYWSYPEPEHPAWKFWHWQPKTWLAAVLCLIALSMLLGMLFDEWPQISVLRNFGIDL